MAIKSIATVMIFLWLANCAQMGHGEPILRTVIILQLQLYFRLLDGCAPYNKPVIPDYPADEGIDACGGVKNGLQKVIVGYKEYRCCTKASYYLRLRSGKWTCEHTSHFVK
ncbi:unnamed protein product [Lymnaea stagnalis]|uniref:Secreted protein n=1 Tax=Lymnaea stagnalis TaxID=6523 RepID=A0AAV2H8V4_LYMST